MPLYITMENRCFSVLGPVGSKCLDEHPTIPKEKEKDVLAETWYLGIKI